MGENARIVGEFLAGIVSGAGTYGVALALFAYLAGAGIKISPRTKRIIVLPICAVIALGALALEVWLGLLTWTPDGIFLALAAAYTASQMFHARELKGTA